MFPGIEIERSAKFSECGIYRYTLERVWDPSKPRLLWVLLNPSTADAIQDDPTNRKGIKFSKLWGYGSCVFVNLFAFRSPHPKIMKACPGPFGPDNDRHLLEQAELADTIMIAWGNDGVHRGQDQKVLKLLGYPGPVLLMCLGRNQNGTPKHPLYLKDDTRPQVFD
ncbi:hypothetical protein LCGC14_0724310 [marine sediment metagenome]|uniref:DUF1643 domain-containing protein n=1 Tax=marine sediment metagenome TaxID=412755 RepID=A0A0F9QFQ6_9ZZZZ